MYPNFRKKWSHFKTIHPEIPLIAFLCKTLMFTIYTNMFLKLSLISIQLNKLKGK